MRAWEFRLERGSIFWSSPFWSVIRKLLCFFTALMLAAQVVTMPKELALTGCEDNS